MIFKNLVCMQNEITNEWSGIEVLELEIKNILKIYQEKEEKLYRSLANNNHGILTNQEIHDVNTSRADLRNSLNMIKVNPTKATLKIRDFEEKIKTLNHNNIFSKEVNIVIEKLYLFYDKLSEFYMNGRNFYLGKEMINLAREVVSKIEILKSQFEYIDKLDLLLEGGVEYSENEVLEINISNKLASKDMIAILQILTEMFDSVKYILKTKEEFEIIKIETGSLFEKLKDNPVVIQIVTAALLTIGRDMYNVNKNTHEKKMMQIREFKEQLELKEILEKEGFDVSNINEELDSLYGKLYKGAKLVMTSSSKIKINNEEFNLESIPTSKLKWEPKYLEYSPEEEL